MGSYNSWYDEGDDDACSSDIHVKMTRCSYIVLCCDDDMILCFYEMIMINVEAMKHVEDVTCIKGNTCNDGDACSDDVTCCYANTCGLDINRVMMIYAVMILCFNEMIMINVEAILHVIYAVT